MVGKGDPRLPQITGVCKIRTLMQAQSGKVSSSSPWHVDPTARDSRANSWMVLLPIVALSGRQSDAASTDLHAPEPPGSRNLCLPRHRRASQGQAGETRIHSSLIITRNGWFPPLAPPKVGSLTPFWRQKPTSPAF